MKQFVYIQNMDEVKSLRVVTAVKIDPLWIKAEDGELFCQSDCFPIEAKDELVAALTERERLVKAANASMALIYQIRNKYGAAK